MTDDVRGELLTAWKEWDEKPTSEQRAKRMVYASRAMADALGTTAIVLRRILAAERRAGKSYEEALAGATTTTKEN